MKPLTPRLVALSATIAVLAVLGYNSIEPLLAQQPEGTPSPPQAQPAAPSSQPSSTVGEATPSPQILPAAGLTRTSILKVQATAVPQDGFNFVFFGDNRDKSPGATEGDAVYARCVAAINKQGALFAVHGGDFTYDNTSTNWQKMLHIEGNLQIPLMTVAGNHDVLHGRSFYESNFGTPNQDTGLEDYRFDYGGVRFIALDNANGTITSRQFAWLEQQLQTPQTKIVMAHMPPHIKPWTGHSLASLEATDEWLKMMDKDQVDMVLLSHIHLFDDSVRRGKTQYIVSGGAGAPFISPKLVSSGVSVHHIVLIDVDPAGKLTYRMVPVD